MRTYLNIRKRQTHRLHIGASEGFCCNDAPKLKSFGSGQNDNPELYQYYYHSDHLSSTSLITNLDSETVQHVEYVPFREVFIEERNNTWNTPYFFNAKEFIEMHGYDTYDYGARGLHPAKMRFDTMDPLCEKYYSISPYAYCNNNLVNAVDPDGREIVFLVRNSSGTITNQLTYRNGNFWHTNGNRYNPGKESISKTLYKTLEAYRKIENSGNKTLIKQLNTLVNSSNVHYVEEGIKGDGSGVSAYKSGKTVSETDKIVANKESVGTQTTLDFSQESKDSFKESTGVENSDFTTVVHEMQHQYDYDQGNMSDSNGQGAKDPAEIRAVKNENRARKIENLPNRTKYGGKEIDPNKL